MRHVHTNQDGFWIEVNGKYQEIQYSSRTRLVGIDCTITFDMSQQDWKKGDLFVGLRGIGGGFQVGEMYEIIEEVEEDNMPQCMKADGSGVRMYIHTKHMGVVSQQDRLRVGDRVEIINHRPYSWHYDNFGTVTRINSFGMQVHLEKNGRPYYTGYGSDGEEFPYCLGLDPHQLKKVIIPKYKEGDVCVFTGKTRHNVGYAIGTKVTLGKLHSTTPGRMYGFIHMCSDGSILKQWIPEEALEPVKPTPKEVVDKMIEIRAGDTVMVTGKSLGYAHSDLSCGDIIKVHKVRGSILHYWHDEDNTDYCIYFNDVKKVITPKKRLCRCSHCKWEYTNPSDGTCGSLVGCSICKHLETHEYIP